MAQMRITRRQFLNIVAVSGGAGLALKLGFGAANNSVIVNDTRLLMGTIINLSVIAENKSAGELAVEATFAELERQVAIFNHREDNSPVAVLNRTGKLAKPPQELVEVLAKANRISNFTNGAFDVSVKPLVDLYQDAQPDLPDAAAVEAALDLVDHTKMTVTSDEISFCQPGMAVTLDGIAKGYIVDAGTAVLRRLGFANVFVEAGGDLMACGNKEGDAPWKIGIQSPRQEQPGLLAQINLSDQAVATSGDYFQYFSADLRNHHIIDPRVGASSPELASATILSANAMVSDALATAVMVLGVDAGFALLDSLDGVEGYLVSKSLDKYRTAGFAAHMGLP